MSYSSQTLQSIINHSFDGKKSNLARVTGLTGATITKLTQDQALTPATIDRICKHLLPDEARALALSACRDLLPQHLADEISINSPTSTNEPTAPYNLPNLDPHSAAIMKALAHLVAKDAESREWLHKLASWMFPDIKP